MRILQLTFNLSQGGAERFVVDICNELVKNKMNEVYLLTINAITPTRRHYIDTLSTDVKHRDIGAKKGLSIKSIMGVYKTIKMIKPDIVHIHCSTVLIYLPAIFYKKAKYVQTLHTLAGKAISFKWLKGIQKMLFKKSIQPITISNICKQSFVDYYQLDNAICIANGRARLAATEKYSSVKKEIEDYKKGKEIPVFIHVARYSHEKNQELLFNTFKRLHDDGKEFLLVVIGANFDKSQYMDLNETNYIKILGVKQNVGDYLACADYFTLSSLYEGLPLSLLEAMSMGCIPISTPAGGVLDVIRDGENGLVSKSFTEDDFYTTVSKVFKEEFIIDKGKIIADYRNNYTMEVCVNKYYDVYKRLLAQ